LKGFAIVVAADAAWGIGKAGDLAWNLPGDMAWFRQVTTGEDPGNARNSVIMGRKTWDTIPERFRPLARRHNVVVSRNRELEVGPEATLVHSLEDALEVPCTGVRFVIGGGMLYADALEHPECEVLYITQVEADFDCDTHMPDPGDRFVLAESQEPVTESGITYRITTWTRR
jgi:dihydrofolate reductase